MFVSALRHQILPIFNLLFELGVKIWAYIYKVLRTSGTYVLTVVEIMFAI